MKLVLRIIACAVFILAGCAETPEEAVEKDFETRKFMTGADLKAKIAEKIEAERKAAYEYFLESDGEEIAKEEAELAAEVIAKPYQNWTDADYTKHADSERRWLAGSKLTIEKVEIKGDTAFVSGVITLRGGAVVPEEYYLLKNKDGKWIVRPPKKEESEEEE